MKKLLLLPILLTLSACSTNAEVPEEVDKPDDLTEEVITEPDGSNGGEDPVVELNHLSEMSASEILNQMIENSEAEFGASFETEITENNMLNYLGSTDYVPFRDTAVYAPMMNIDVSLLLVLQVEDINDVDTLVDQLVENIDPNRLICVSFDYEDMVIRHMEDTVVVIINKFHKDALDKGFMEIITGDLA